GKAGPLGKSSNSCSSNLDAANFNYFGMRLFINTLNGASPWFNHLIRLVSRHGRIGSCCLNACYGCKPSRRLMPCGPQNKFFDITYVQPYFAGQTSFPRPACVGYSCSPNKAKASASY